ncbi:MAG: glycosyltransferase [Candidatus Viridilinea halotolerans]|uniref:Glycosyltransferase n=1 Tax=Candidatus Viridilinea halotolerans TaxID=2491704 RepID=A0A426TVR0_9CHLR|nr:MAG: glycosyltransferase [Candidatus Viridilinea halotolerans]
MHTTLLTGEYPPQPGGVGDYTQCLAQALTARGHQISILTIQAGRLRGLHVAAHQATPCLNIGHNLTWSHRCWPAIISALDQLRPAWLHIQYQTGAYAMLPGINLLPWRLRALAGRPRIAVTFHDLREPYLFPKAGPLRTWVNQYLARASDATIVTNASDAASWRSNGGLARRCTHFLSAASPHSRIPASSPSLPHHIPIGTNIAVAPPPGYQRTAWRAGCGVAPATFVVAYFGLLSPSKGADQLLAALAQLAPPWRLIIIGGAATSPQDSAYAKTLRRQIASLNCNAHVQITGHLPDHDVSGHLLAADCIALPFRDGASFRRGSLLAALAHGCPVITTQPSHASEQAMLAPATLLVPRDVPDALRHALERMRSDPALRAQLAQQGRVLAAQFAWSAIAAQHERIYSPCTDG